MGKRRLIVIFQHLKGAYKGADFLHIIMKGQGRMDLNWREKGRFGSDVRKKFFIQRVVRHWNTPLREALDAPFPEVFKARLDGILSSLI